MSLKLKEESNGSTAVRSEQAAWKGQEAENLRKDLCAIPGCTNRRCMRSEVSQFWFPSFASLPVFVFLQWLVTCPAFGSPCSFSDAGCGSPLAGRI